MPVIVVLAALRLAAPAGIAQEREVEVRPPIPVSLSVDVGRGETVRIVLQAVGKPAQLIDFLIRSNPQHGRLEPADRVSGTGSAPVVYQHDGTGHEDAFEFATQSPGSPVSKPARVTIRIVDAPPRLTLSTPLLDFGELPPGEHAIRSFRIRNTGGGILRGRLMVPPEISLGQSPHYALGMGEEALWEATFTPRRIGRYRSEIAIENEERPGIGVVASVRPLFEVTPSLVVLEPPRREARVRVANPWKNPVHVRVQVPEPFEADESLVIAPGESAECALRIGANHAGLAEGEMILAAGPQEVRVQVRALALPGRLTVTNAAELGAVHEVPFGNRAEVILQLANVGGTPVEAEVAINPAEEKVWTVDPDKVRLPPGGTCDVRVQAALKAGRTDVDAVVKWPGTVVNIPLRFLVAGRSETMSARNPSAPPHQATEPRVGPAEVPTAAGPPLAAESEVTVGEVRRLLKLTRAFRGVAGGPPGPEGLRVLAVGPSHVELVWSPSPGPVNRYQLELRRLTASEEEGVEAEWLPISNVSIRPHDDGLMRAELRGVPPERVLVFRVRGMLPDGTATRPSNLVRVVVQGTTVPLAGWAGMAAVACAIGAVLWWRLRRRVTAQTNTAC